MRGKKNAATLSD